MSTIVKPKVTLVGAGPGETDLITIKGMKALQNAHVILYDALINRQLLDFAPRALKIFVGKRKGYQRCSQQEINELMAIYAFEYGQVVRLKGGDPFIFGRGSEEIDYMETLGIETDIIPGISSAIAVPANQGISLTKRGISESFWVITGTTSEKKLSEDLFLAAQSTATLVILMGMSKLADIVNIFKQFGKGGLPVAIIQNGTTKNEKIGLGTVNSILEEVVQKQLSSPAVIVMGEVVKESAKLSSFYAKLNLVGS